MNGSVDFWISSGHHLLDRREDGRLVPTGAFLKLYLARPELAPVPESCPAERALHARLLSEPTSTVSADEIEAIADHDVRENYTVVLRFRDHLLAHQTLESAYLALFSGDLGATPALFIDQLAHVILRSVLDGTVDPQRVRAAELFFRQQRVSITEGGILLADEEAVETNARTGGFGGLGDLLASVGTPTRMAELDVLNEQNEAAYWRRSDAFDMVLDLSFSRPGLDAFCRVIEAWVSHFTGVAVSVQPVQTIRDERWSWHVGLEAESSRILNAMWNGADVPQADLARILALFRLEFANPADMLERIAGRPVYLALAMTAGRTLRMKPQNLLVGLPFAPSVVATRP